ncbi:FGGY-family carbohydrate kinase [Nostocoides vanveenii]|uniref:FGGY-family carbohydrate kinase n=1 Tax=Nostocoides vanveenii TaxID=330835 RepID=UPI0031D2ADF9
MGDELPDGLLAGIDAGTTSVKVLLMTPDGRDVAVGRAPTTWSRTAQGEETTAETLTGAAQAALADALAQAPGARILGIGVASMAESGVLVDSADVPLAPVIAWHDTRDSAELAGLIATLSGEEFSRRTGLPLWTQWSATKHRWMRAHLPETARATRRYNVAEWIIRGLGGDPVTEFSLASRTGWLDLHTGRPWAESLAWSGAPDSLLGDLVDAGVPVGHAQGAGPLAAISGAVLTIAGHDHQTAAVGLGAHRPGDEFDSAGTAEAILRTSHPNLLDSTVADLAAAGITVGRHAAPGRWCLLGATQGGLILGRVQHALGVDRDGLAALDDAAAAAADVPTAITLGPGAGDVQINPAATPGEVWRAATRAVTGQAAALSDRLTAASGPRADLVVAGGWTNSRAVMAAKTDAFGDFRRATVPEAGCRGAALFAGVAAGLYTDLDAAPAPA